MKIVSVVGARPNFMKMAPLMHELKKYPEIKTLLVHTGQHYDRAMSQQFFDELGLPTPDIDLGVGSASHSLQTAEVMIRFEPVLVRERPDWVLVVGDVNSTLAAALTASKRGIPVAHVESGLRSFDRTMPEEINRVLTDAISDLLFTTERSAIENLLREGIPSHKIFFVGNVMIDTLRRFQTRNENPDILFRLGLQETLASAVAPYAVLTLHRPSNVDDLYVLKGILEALSKAASRMPIVFPCHPRTRKRIHDGGLDPLFGDPTHPLNPGLYWIEPLGYVDFLQLMSRASFVLTDSGGIQEETTVLGIPCLTLRDNTERPVTVSQGTNRIVGSRSESIKRAIADLATGGILTHEIPELWDGQAARRIVEVLIKQGLLAAGGRMIRKQDDGHGIS